MQIPQKSNFERTAFGVLIACFFCIAFLHAADSAHNPELGDFPSIQVTSLDGAKLYLPKDFSGELNLVVISFAREQQQEVDTWIPLAQQMQSAHNNFSYYELPTASRENLLYRWWLDSSLRSNTTDKTLRARTLTAYVNKHRFQKKLSIANDKRIVALLVTQTGKILWRTDGACTGAAKLGLQSALAANGE
ncbi:MAG: hypothetical protein ABI164_02005 [Acidobacteriaceae bacterium]